MHKFCPNLGVYSILWQNVRLFVRSFWKLVNCWNHSQYNHTQHTQSTDGARGKTGFARGRHAWEIVWEGPLGTVAVIGIATKEAPNQCHGYVALLGSNDQSWGWNLVDNHLLHNGDSQGNYPQLNNAPKYQVKYKIQRDNGRLKKFYVDSNLLVAF